MKKILILAGLSGLVIAFTSFDRQHTFLQKQNLIEDSLAADRAKYVAIINDQIKGKEKMKVDSVFTNLKVLGGFPAEILPNAMNSWSHALGVSCGHCHNTDNFTLDEKPKKEIARDMVRMGNIISQQLKNIKGLSARPIVNCTTCHRGELKPALNLPASK